MAKKNADVEAFLADLLEAIPDEGRRKAVEEAVRDEAVMPKFRDGVLAKSEFSRQMDSLKAREAELQRMSTEATANAQAWSDWYAKASSEVATVKDQLKRYETEYGPLDPAVRREMQGGPKMLSEEDFSRRLAEELQKRDLAAIAVADDLTDLKIQHREDFKEPLNTQEVITYATKNGLRLKQAYDEMMKGRREEVREKLLEERIAREREDAVRDYAGKHALPFTPGAPEPSGIEALMGGGDRPNYKTQRDRVNAALTEFGKQPQSA